MPGYTPGMSALLPPEAPQDWNIPPGYAAGAPVPWWVKFGVKLVLGALPVPPRFWRAIGLRRHSFGARDAARLVAPLAAHARLFQDRVGRPPRGVLELGPGAMVSRAPVAAALGFGPIWYLDVEDDAPRDLAPYIQAAEAARAAGLTPPDLSACTTREAVLAACGARYLVGGTAALAAIPPGSVDLVFSEVVLEHVRRDALTPLLAALAGVMAPDGLGLHSVDFHDHLGGALRHLNFAPEFWEGRAVGRAALYCNRLGLSEVLERFASAGQSPSVTSRGLWAEAPVHGRGPHPALGRRAEDARVAFAIIEARHA